MSSVSTGVFQPPESEQHALLGIALDLSSSMQGALSQAKDLALAITVRNRRRLSTSRDSSPSRWLYENISATNLTLFLSGFGFRGGNGLIDLSGLLEANLDPAVQAKVAAARTGPGVAAVAGPCFGNTSGTCSDSPGWVAWGCYSV